MTHDVSELPLNGPWASQTATSPSAIWDVRFILDASGAVVCTMPDLDRNSAAGRAVVNLPRLLHVAQRLVAWADADEVPPTFDDIVAHARAVLADVYPPAPADPEVQP